MERLPSPSRTRNQGSQADLPKLLAIGEVADFLRLSTKTIRRLAESGVEFSDQQASEILGAIRLIEILLTARAITPPASAAPAMAASEPTDAWLTADEVAARLRRTRGWVYRRARRWPFAKRPSRKTLLISERGLARWMEHR